MRMNGSTVQGVIMDSVAKMHIPYASVYFNSKCGTITDFNGDFVLYAKKINSEDSLWVSCIGYHRKSISVKDLSFTEINKIYLIPVVYSLDTSEISTAKITPYQLLQDAFKNIKTNSKDDKHFYKGTYFEQIRNYDHVKKWHSRTLNCAVIVEDPGYGRTHGSSLGINENIYILGINKSTEDSITKVLFNEPNYLSWTMENNYYRYDCSYFDSPRSYDYKIKSTYYDSIIKKNMIEISITSKKPKKKFVNCEVYLSSSDHKIYKMHVLYQYKPKDTLVSSGSKNYYRYNSDVIVIYKPDNNNKMELSYIKYEFEDGDFRYEDDKPVISSKRTMEYKVIGEVEKGEDLVKGISKMDNNTRIYDQKVIDNKDFWLENNVILKE